MILKYDYTAANTDFLFAHHNYFLLVFIVFIFFCFQVAMDTLNLMHRVFDEIVEKNGRVYRLHWDGATVVAVGGVPFGLELDPVHSIAQIAFEYMIWAYNSRTPFNQPLKLRFGIHSGAVSAGCLDYSAPHYVLFGDLMKTAYLIETASKPYRILVSEDFNDQLKKRNSIKFFN